MLAGLLNPIKFHVVFFAHEPPSLLVKQFVIGNWKWEDQLPPLPREIFRL